MLYGKAKERQMARSVLPSTSRRFAAEKLATIRRHARRSSTQRLNGLVVAGPAAGVVEAWEDFSGDERAWPQHEIKYAVRDRRDADKVAPLQRWAVARTRHLPPEERIDAIGSILSPDLIGRHALSHVEWLDEFSGHLEHLAIYRRPAAKAPRKSDREVVTEELERVVADGELGAFNRHMKSAGCRVLAGAHDIEAYVEAYGKPVASYEMRLRITSWARLRA